MNDKLYNYLANDKNCIFALVPDKDEFSKKIFPLTEKNIRNGEIYKLSNIDVTLNNNGEFIYDAINRGEYCISSFINLTEYESLLSSSQYTFFIDYDLNKIYTNPLNDGSFEEIIHLFQQDGVIDISQSIVYNVAARAHRRKLC